MTAAQEILTVARTRDGKPVREDLAFEFVPAAADGPALLLIATGWLKRAARFKKQDLYAVRPMEAGWGGRAFRLDRSPDVVQADPDRVTHYSCLVAADPGEDLCDCKGQAGCERRLQACKHLEVLRHLVGEGRI